MPGRRPAFGWDEDQCWTLARITQVVRRRFGVDYTLAGMDLLLHRMGWSVQVPARAQRTAQIAGHGVDVDRSRDPGLVAAVIVHRLGNDVVIFDLVIMSCQATGFGLEREMGFSKTSDGVCELDGGTRVAAVPDWFQYLSLPRDCPPEEAGRPTAFTGPGGACGY